MKTEDPQCGDSEVGMHQEHPPLLSLYQAITEKPQVRGSAGECGTPVLARIPRSDREGLQLDPENAKRAL